MLRTGQRIASGWSGMHLFRAFIPKTVRSILTERLHALLHSRHDMITLIAVVVRRQLTPNKTGKRCLETSFRIAEYPIPRCRLPHLGSHPGSNRNTSTYWSQSSVLPGRLVDAKRAGLKEGAGQDNTDCNGEPYSPVGRDSKIGPADTSPQNVGCDTPLRTRKQFNSCSAFPGRIRATSASTLGRLSFTTTPS